ncbi:phosphotransacetylase [Tissierellia bacterium S7-1-4]|uniref:phosphate acetyltransferase n=1 Tax=Ezakiella coagulans TaxID=46507 RepID=UPI00050E6398|nr:phosphate acetyltransferase [Ezakiella coagulans]KGF07469.1 phosphotransacetylase [Tissierellia bacterium S7-1-4]UQK61556.1 phosphate acetyltransferase [Ezakiella coagulans]
MLIDELKKKLEGKNASIILPEGEDERVREAAKILKKEGIIEPIVLTDGEEIEGVKTINVHDYDITEMVDAFVERRNGKIDAEGAKKLVLEDKNYFGTMLVYMKKASGLVSGACHSTANTVRPALQIIKMKKPFKKTSGVFVMMKGTERYIFTDCAINIAPTSEDIAENAIISYDTAKAFGIDEPKIALLSFSTKGSASSPEVDKVADALKLIKEQAPNLVIDGELQFDAAFVPKVGETKAKGSPVAGHANVFVFPSLEAGNIGYKIAQRMGGFEAIGPILQGLNSPVNDLSRGCSTEDVVALSYLTAAQSL